jgi:hypothetical protein
MAKYINQPTSSLTTVFSTPRRTDSSQRIDPQKKRSVIPENLRAYMIQRLHHSHCGMEATLKFALETVNWLNITDHIKNKIGGLPYMHIKLCF